MTILVLAIWMSLDSAESKYYRLAMASGFMVVFACSAARATYWHTRRDKIERGIVTIGKWAAALGLAVFAFAVLRDLGWL